MGLFGRKRSKKNKEVYNIEEVLRNIDKGIPITEFDTSDDTADGDDNTSADEIYRSDAVKLDDTGLGKKPTMDDVRKYIDTAGSRIAMMHAQNDKLRGEYESVTEYLKDIQMIESIEGKEKTRLNSYAYDIVKKEEENRKRLGYEPDIKDAHYKTMKLYEESMNRELINMKKKELYQADIKNDLKYLEEEKEKLYDEQDELLGKTMNIRGISIGGGVLIVSLMILFGVLWVVAGQDMTIPYILLIFLSGLLILYIFMGMRTSRYEIILTDKKLSKCINLLNSVKIKYVNNTALLDYMCSKYKVSNSVELEHVWQQYIKLRENEEALSANAEDLVVLKKSLTDLLEKYGLKDTSIWVVQAKALLDEKEMVEVRHSLNVRRQKLRKQIGYNDDQIRKDSLIIQKFLKKKPQLREQIKDVMTRYGIEHIVIQALRQ